MNSEIELCEIWYQMGEKVYGVSPVLIISISEGRDIHVRKAKFDPLKCPSNCPKPYERICPTFAIDYFGVKENKCYRCGRCINSCPLNLISEYKYKLSNNDIPHTLQTIKPDEVEIHTEINRLYSVIQVANILKTSGIKLKKYLSAVD